MDQPQLQAWERQAQALLLSSSAAENEGVKRLIENLNDEIARIDDALLNADSEEISDRQRDRIIDQKKIYRRILSYFDVEKEIEELEKQIDQNL